MALLSQLHDLRQRLNDEYGAAYFVFIAPIDLLLCEALDVWRWVREGKQPPYTLFGPEMELDVYLIDRQHVSEAEPSGPIVLHRAGKGLSGLKRSIGSLQ
jgi:hypothetical protein